MTARYLESHCIVDSGGRAANLKANLSRGLPVCADKPEREGQLAITGSGPSLSEHLDELRDWPGDIWAINGSYDFLLQNGIRAEGFFGLDPLPTLAEYVQNAQPETTYYLASTCDPAVLDALEGRDVWLWHGADEELDKFPAGSKIIYGGTTAVTRAPFLGLVLGWRNITLFGVDSSYVKTGPYCYCWGSYKEDIDQPIMPVMINGEGPFYTELGLLRQVSQLYAMLGLFNKNREILKIREAGLMGAFLRSPMLDDSMIEIEENDGTADAA